MHQIIAFLKFLWHSKNQHGVHSPFVFDLVTQCFYKKHNPERFQLYTKYRKALLKDDNVIEVTDYGAGSRVFDSPKRSVAAIAKNAGASPKKAALLSRISHYFQPKHILEIGTSLGLGTVAMHAGQPLAKITTLEGCPETAKIAQKAFDNLNESKITIQLGAFKTSLPEVTQAAYDLVLFDGNHSFNGTLNYFDMLLKCKNNESVFIFDDIHWSREMEAAWKEIKEHPEVTLTVDTFYYGLVFFRKEQFEKEHFIIRV